MSVFTNILLKAVKICNPEYSNDESGYIRSIELGENLCKNHTTFLKENLALIFNGCVRGKKHGVGRKQHMGEGTVESHWIVKE